MQSPTMSARRRKRLEITQDSGITFISLGNMEIWDGADLALIRDTLIEQIQEYDRQMLAIDMESVKYIPSGFFGMLSEWKDRGICISIKGVQKNVANMVWFQQFFLEASPGLYHLQHEPKFEMNTIFAEPEMHSEQMIEQPQHHQIAGLEEMTC